MGAPPQIRRIQSLSVDEINKALREIQDQMFRDRGESQGSSSSGSSSDSIPFFQGPRAARGGGKFSPSSLPLGSLYFETDTTLTYEVRSVNSVPLWTYAFGVHEGSWTQRLAGLGPLDLGVEFRAVGGPQNGIRETWSGTGWLWSSGSWTDVLAQIPTLSSSEVGGVFSASDYLHSWRWTGVRWHFAPGDASGYVVGRTSGFVPHGGLWAICDGSSVSVAQDDGTISSEATPDTLGSGGDHVFIMGDSSGVAKTSASRLLWDGAAKTGVEDATHTHDVVVDGTSNIYASGTDFLAALPGTYTSTTESATHHHPLTNALSILQTPSEDATHGGLPLRVGLVWYFRR